MSRRLNSCQLIRGQRVAVAAAPFGRRSVRQRAWGRYEFKTSKLDASDDVQPPDLGDYDPRPFGKISCHYPLNRFFLQEGRLLRDAHRLKDIPITIINGRYDVLCPPIYAWRLHQRLPKSKLIIVEQAGHSETEPGITRALLKPVAAFD